VVALLSDDELLQFSYHPDQNFPVFSPESSALRFSSNGDSNSRWPTVGQNPVRLDGEEPVVQLPARFFADYKGPNTAIPLEPVREAAQVSTEEKLHFVIAWPSYVSTFQCFLLTTTELAETGSDLLPELFYDHQQRSLLLDNLEASDMESDSNAVGLLFQRLTEIINSQ